MCPLWTVSASTLQARETILERYGENLTGVAPRHGLAQRMAVHGRRQMLRQDEIFPPKQQHGPFHGVFQFPDIARPAVALQHVHHRQRKARAVAPRRQRVFLQKMVARGRMSSCRARRGGRKMGKTLRR